MESEGGGRERKRRGKGVILLRAGPEGPRTNKVFSKSTKLCVMSKFRCTEPQSRRRKSRPRHLAPLAVTHLIPPTTFVTHLAILRLYNRLDTSSQHERQKH